jgi:hypothetical protein
MMMLDWIMFCYLSSTQRIRLLFFPYLKLGFVSGWPGSGLYSYYCLQTARAMAAHTLSSEHEWINGAGVGELDAELWQHLALGTPRRWMLPCAADHVSLVWHRAETNNVDSTVEIHDNFISCDFSVYNFWFV